MQANVAVVTGGADGFGATITDRFHQEGYQVIIIDINKEKGEQKASGGPNIHFLFGDVTQQDTWEQERQRARANKREREHGKAEQGKREALSAVGCRHKKTLLRDLDAAREHHGMSCPAACLEGVVQVV